MRTLEHDPAKFELFKERMLSSILDQLDAFELHAKIIHAAARASTLAQESGLPFLTFPCLLQEEVLNAKRVHERAMLKYRQPSLN
jgi:hypothetical protein